MRKLILLTFISISFNAFANNLENSFESTELNKICQRSAQFTPTGSVNKLKMILADEKFIYFGFRDNKNNNGEVVFKNRSNSSEISYKLEGNIHNLQQNDSEVLILTDTELFVINKQDHSLIFKTKTLPNNLRSSKNARPYGVYKYNQIYYIAHGKHGIVPFDSETMKHLPAILPIVPQPNSQLTSIVTDIVGIGEQVYVAMDNLNLDPNLRGFEGLIIYNLTTNKIENTIPVNQRLEAYHMPNLSLDNEEIIVTNYNLNFRHKLSSLTRAKYMTPLRRIWRYPLGQLIGRGFIQDKKIYGCFKNYDKKELSAGWMSLE